MTDLLSAIAHQITGCNGSTCCHKTGGRGGPDMRPGCECRETADTILALVQKGCICPPGSEATCRRIDCGRKHPVTTTTTAYHTGGLDHGS